METIKLKVIKIGNSLGIIFPKEFAKEQNLKSGVEIVVTIKKDT